MDNNRKNFAYAIRDKNSQILDWGLITSSEMMGPLKIYSEMLAETFVNENNYQVDGVLSVEFRDLGNEPGDIVFRLDASKKITFTASEVNGEECE